MDGGKDTEVSTLGVLAGIPASSPWAGLSRLNTEGQTHQELEKGCGWAADAPTKLGVWQAGGKHSGQSF